MNENHVDIQIMDPHVPALNASDLAELGALYVTAGFTTVQARAMVQKVQQVAAQVAMLTAPDILDEVRKIQEARILEMLQRVRLLPNTLGWISRDRVLQIIQDVSARPPRQ